MTNEDRRAGGDGKGGDQDARWYLNDERDFLRRSIEDAEREHGAGDLSAEDRDVLVARDRERLDAVDLELASLGPAARQTPEAVSVPAVERASMSWPRRLGIVVSCAFIVTGVVILVVHATQSRLPGQVSSGGITESQLELENQQLNQAETLNAHNQDVAALKLYAKVLHEDPTNPAALAEDGWLKWKNGFAQHDSLVTKNGRAEVERAVSIDPSFYESRYFLGVILVNQDHNAKGAVTQFDAFLSDNPPVVSVQQSIGLLTSTYAAAGIPLPPALSASTTTTTTSAP